MPNDLNLHPSTPLASYFCAIHPLGELFSCRPYNSLSVPPFGQLCLCRPSHLGELFSCRKFNSPSLILASYFRADHYLTVHPSIPLANYFCAVHLLGELFSCRLFIFPSFYPFGELLLSTVLISFLASVWRVIFCYKLTSVSSGHL